MYFPRYGAWLVLELQISLISKPLFVSWRSCFAWFMSYRSLSRLECNIRKQVIEWLDVYMICSCRVLSDIYPSWPEGAMFI